MPGDCTLHENGVQTCVRKHETSCNDHALSKVTIRPHVDCDSRGKPRHADRLGRIRGFLPPKGVGKAK